MSSIEEDLVPQRLMKRLKAGENGRLEVTWRIYDALCHISTGDWTEEQRRFLKIEQKAAYERWALEGELMNKDGLQGKRGFAAAKRQHLKELKEKKKL
jgi:hypothetical protein